MIFNSIARFSVRFRWLIIIAWLIAVPLAVKTLPSLSSVAQTSNTAFLPTNAASQKAANLAQPFQGSATAATVEVVAVRGSGPLTQADKNATTRVEQAAGKLKDVSFVHDQGFSADGQAQQLLVGIGNAAYGNDAQKIIDNLRSTFSSAGAPAGLSFHATGSLAESIDSERGGNTARNKTEGYILLLIIVLLLLVYRSVLAPIITLIPAGLSLIIAGPIIAESTKIGVQVSLITQLLLVVLILGAGTDYGLFLVFRVREELRNGLEPKQAVTRALSKVGETITFSAATVIAALLSLLLATFGFYKGLGPALAIGLGIMLLSALTFLPAVLAVFGRRAFWPSKTRITDQRLGFWGKLADRVIERPVVTLVAGVILFGVLIAGMIGYSTTGFTSNGSPAGSDSAKGAAAIAAHFPAANNNPQEPVFRFNSSVWNSASVLQKAQSELAVAPSFAAIAGPFNPQVPTLTPAELVALYQQLGPPANLPSTPPSSLNIPIKLYEAYRATAQFISPDGKTVQFYGILKAGPTGTAAAMNAIPAVRTDVANVAKDIDATNNGLLSVDAFSYDISHAATSDLWRIIPVVLIIIAALLAILLRSLVAPWYLIATVGLSYLATLGFAMLVFVHFGNNPGLNFILPFLLFIFSMALGEDYNILVMSRIREEAGSHKALKAAITKAIGVTGTTVTSAGLILAGTFTVLGIVGGDSQVQQIGFAVAFGILLDTFFVRTLLVPSIAVMLGRWNWWPSKLSRQTEV